MPVVSLVAAVDENFGLGKNNQLLCHLPADLSHFKKVTMSKPIIMGRKTYESIGRPLPGRLNIVLSRNTTRIDGVEIAASLTHAFELAGEVEEIMIIGGAELFNQSLNLANRIYLTIIHNQFEADVYFPSFEVSEWNCIQSDERPADEKNPYSMTFLCYERK